MSRASVHNISIMEELELGIGDRIEVYKANMIIPQIARNLTRSGVRDIPRVCPVCGGETEIRQEGSARMLYCTNPRCQAKQIKAYALFVSRDAMNIEGLSEATLEKFIARGFIQTYDDLFHLDRHREEIQEMEGFGEKSYQNLMESVERARQTTLPRLLYSLGIPGIGVANARVICRETKVSPEALPDLTEEELSAVSGVGGVIAKAYVDYFEDETHRQVYGELLGEVHIEQETAEEGERPLEGTTFVITGSVEHFANRSELKSLIESKGGKVTGSVTSKTSYLINNDAASTSSKNRKAKELGVPILTEEEFLQMLE